MFSLDVIVNIVITIFVLIGIYAASCWSYDNLKSLVTIIVAVLRPFFQPEEKQTLAQKYGNWAGWSIIIIY